MVVNVNAEELFKNPPASEICKAVVFTKNVNGREAEFAAGYFDLQLRGPSPDRLGNFPSPRPGYVCRITRKYSDESEPLEIALLDTYDTTNDTTLFGIGIVDLKLPRRVSVGVGGGFVWAFFTNHGVAPKYSRLFKVAIDAPGKSIIPVIDYEKSPEYGKLSEINRIQSYEVIIQFPSEWQREVYYMYQEHMSIKGIDNGILELRCGIFKGATALYQKEFRDYVDGVLERERKSHQLDPNTNPPAREHLLTDEIILRYDIATNRSDLSIPKDSEDLIGVIVQTPEEQEKFASDFEKNRQLEMDAYEKELKLKGEKFEKLDRSGLDKKLKSD